MAEDEEAEKKARILWREQQIQQLRTDSRMGLPFGMRLPLAISISFLVGMGLGVSHGSQVAGLRFRAENAHRLPSTPTGWYLYHKSKNYQMAFGGVKEGIKMGAKVSFWTASFFSIEETFDRYRGTKDFINTVIASLTVAGGFSLYSMLLSSPMLPLSKLTSYRSIPNHHSSENGEKWTGHRIGIWIGARCSGSFEGKKAEICGMDSAKDTTESRYKARAPSNSMIISIAICLVSTVCLQLPLAEAAFP
jgi:hypothetical protein